MTFSAPPVPDSKRPVVLPDGRTVWAYYSRPAHRPSGRRIVVRDDRGTALHDTKDHYDAGNAEVALEAWLRDPTT